MVQMAFNANQYDPSTGASDVLETGVYSVQIVNSEVKQTKKQDGYMLVFTLSCMDQHVNGRKIMARLNIHNPNAQAVEIAYRELSAISHVVGILNWQDTQQLHGRPFKVSVEKVERNDKPGAFSNNILAYMDYAGNPPNTNGGGNSPQAPATPPQQPPQQQMQAPASQPVSQTAPAPATYQQAAAPGTPATGAPAPAGGAPWQPPPAEQQPQQPQQQAPWQNAAPAAGAPQPPWQTQG